MAFVDELERMEPFVRMTPPGKALLAQGAVVKHASRATALLHKGQPVSGAYLVLSGRLRVFTMSPNGTEATLYFIDPGQTCVLALNCLFSDLLYPAWVETEASTRVAQIPGAVYRRLFESERVIQDLTVRALSTLVYRLMDEVEQLHTSHHKQRLVQFVLLHAATDGSLRMTQQQLAQHLGTSREVVARLIRDLVSAGYLKTQRGLVRINDVDGLRALIAPGISRRRRAPPISRTTT